MFESHFKSNQKLSSSKTETISSQSLQNSVLSQKTRHQGIRCINGKLSKHACSNKHCEKFAFVCDQEDCKCHEEHQWCCLILTKSVLKCLQKKIIPIESLEQSINDNFDKFIDELSQIRDKMVNSIREVLKYCGLNTAQINIIQAIKSQKVESLKGSDIWNANVDVLPKQNILIQMKQTQARITESINQLKQRVESIKNQISNFILFSNDSSKNFHQDYQNHSLEDFTQEITFDRRQQRNYREDRPRKQRRYDRVEGPRRQQRNYNRESRRQQMANMGNRRQRRGE